MTTGIKHHTTINWLAVLNVLRFNALIKDYVLPQMNKLLTKGEKLPDLRFFFHFRRRIQVLSLKRVRRLAGKVAVVLEMLEGALYNHGSN